MMAAQFDLFAPPPPAPPAPAAAPIKAATAEISPGGRDFATRKIAAWSHRAAELVERQEKGAAHRALGLEQAVGNLARAVAGEDRIAQLKVRLAACQPYDHGSGIRFNDGPIMADVRAAIEAELAALEGGRG